MRVRIFDDLTIPRVQAVQRVLLVRRVPDHVTSIDADGVRTGLRPRQLEFLERFRVGIEAADLAPSSLAEPDDSVGIDLETLRFAFRRRIEFGQHAILRDSGDRAVLPERSE